MIRVVVFEDNVHLMETYRLLLNGEEDMVCVAAYANGRDPISKLNRQPFDVALMDIEMPGMNGIEITKLVKTNFPNALVLIQTVFFDDDHIFKAICAGAAGYLLKSSNPEEYLNAIRSIVAGGAPMTPEIARKVLQLFKSNVSAPPSPTQYGLTPQEVKVLQLLVDGKSYKMIATELFVSFDTIKSHIRNIYNKLQVHSGTEAVALAINQKLV
ncbi:MAG: response regulator transcription factor [Saprospiraceae bacterium]|nr:response regulator transcription factor [Saprospiraceae bacterium]MBK8633672.1 response regulator transcription factor [Saprospiraceae bacterium]MBP7642360.1 response regulator transcription factor [Saprospiraceae bacterium]